MNYRLRIDFEVIEFLEILPRRGLLLRSRFVAIRGEPRGAVEQARAVVGHFLPCGRIVEPSAGNGAFLRALPEGADWHEIENWRDCLNANGPASGDQVLDTEVLPPSGLRGLPPPSHDPWQAEIRIAYLRTFRRRAGDSFADPGSRPPFASASRSLIVSTRLRRFISVNSPASRKLPPHTSQVSYQICACMTSTIRSMGTWHFGHLSFRFQSTVAFGFPVSALSESFWARRSSSSNSSNHRPPHFVQRSICSCPTWTVSMPEAHLGQFIFFSFKN